MPIAEFWVMRVVLSKRTAEKWRKHAPGWQPERVRTAFAKVVAGDYTEVGGMGILEPVECYDSNVKASDAAIVMAQKHPTETFVTVLNADADGIRKDPTADGAMKE